MKKTVLVIALFAAAGAMAQSAPAPAMVAPAQPANGGVLVNNAVPNADKPLPTGINPFTGISRGQSEIERTQEELKRMRMLSTEKLSLQRDELEALRVELEKKKVLDALNPPKPVEPPKPIPVAKPKAEPVVKVVTPPQIISAAPTKFETPEIVGVIDIAGQKVAMVNFDKRNFRAQVGSVVGGRAISGITSNGVQWGNQFLSVATKSSVPSFVITDDRTDMKKAQPTSLAITQQPAIAPVLQRDNTPVYLNPQGAQRISNGATGPSGVLSLPPPPPTLGR